MALRMTMVKDDNGIFIEDDNSMPDTKVHPAILEKHICAKFSLPIKVISP